MLTSTYSYTSSNYVANWKSQTTIGRLSSSQRNKSEAIFGRLSFSKHYTEGTMSNKMQSHVTTTPISELRMMAQAADNNDVPPPKSLLMYLVRMGSFTSSPKYLNEDTADDDLDDSLDRDYLIERCRQELKRLPNKIIRRWIVVDGHHNDPPQDDFIRVMQWNILSQALGEKTDNFVSCPLSALDWRIRRWRIFEEILTYRPDIICLQEVDHFNFLKKTLGVIGYLGFFFPKPDSPCYYIKGNNGPDGCAVFYNSNKFVHTKTCSRILEVWTCQSNQVALLTLLKRKKDGREICVVTTHLKARQGTLLPTLRNEQGKDLLEFIRMHYNKRSVVICGDFNAEPTEPVYRTMLSCQEVKLDSIYRHLSNHGVEPPYTTWKIREEGEVCQTLDYIFYTPQSLKVRSILQLPTGEDIGMDRVPSFSYPSDHFSLVCDLRFNETS